MIIQISLVHQLIKNVFDRREECCEIMTTRTHPDENFLFSCFSYEATLVRCQSTCFPRSPYSISRKSQCLSRYFSGPFNWTSISLSLPHRRNLFGIIEWYVYLQLVDTIETQLLTIVEDHLIFQQGGAPPHYKHPDGTFPYTRSPGVASLI